MTNKPTAIEMRALALAVNATRITGAKATVGTGTGEALACMVPGGEVNVVIMRDDERLMVAKLTEREARLMVARHV